jgi:hypothetical protein
MVILTVEKEKTSTLIHNFETKISHNLFSTVIMSYRYPLLVKLTQIKQV